LKFLICREKVKHEHEKVLKECLPKLEETVEFIEKTFTTEAIVTLALMQKKFEK